MDGTELTAVGVSALADILKVTNYEQKSRTNGLTAVGVSALTDILKSQCPSMFTTIPPCQATEELSL